MAEHYIRINGEWKNVCSNEIYFRHATTGEWRKFNSGDSVWITDEWILITCLELEPCGGSIAVNGGQYYPEPYQHEIELGSSTGITRVRCKPYSVPDKFEIWWNDQLQATTGYIGSNGSLADEIFNITGETMTIRTDPVIISFNKTLVTPTKALLKVYAPLDSTYWGVDTYCPGQ